MTNFVLGNLDNDGFTDIVGVSNTGQVMLYRNTYNAMFSGPYLKNNLNSKVNDIKLADLDRDGDLDMVFGLQNGSIFILENQQYTH